MPTTNAPQTIYQVSELNTMVRDLLTHSFSLLWIEGEISNMARPRSGHVYFTLKDDNAQVRCALFRSKARLLRFTPDSGDRVLVRARVSLYAVRGDYQLIVEHMAPAGAGALQRAFEQLKAKLDAEGLFADSRKRALPSTPARIGIITSATGAALRDVISVLSRRFSLGALRIYPVAVQGQAAPAQIRAALQRADQRRDCDVLLLVRGGGSLEDLQAFNDEGVARAIADCTCPIISGVGHEVDFTIADFVADRRAPTPSAAAELVCPDMSTLDRRLNTHEQRLHTAMQRRCRHARERRDSLETRLRRQHPHRRIEDAMQRLDDNELRLVRTMSQQLQTAVRRHTHWHERLLRASPSQQTTRQRMTCDHLQQRLQRAIRHRLDTTTQRMNTAVRALHTVSPLQTLDRGYAIARDAEGHVLRTTEHTRPQDRISVTLHHGQLACRVIATESDRRETRHHA